MLNELAALLGGMAGTNADPTALVVYFLIGLLVRRWIWVALATITAAIIVTAYYRSYMASIVPPGWPAPRPFEYVATLRAGGALIVASAVYAVAHRVRRSCARRAAIDRARRRIRRVAADEALQREAED